MNSTDNRFAIVIVSIAGDGAKWTAQCFGAALVWRSDPTKERCGPGGGAVLWRRNFSVPDHQQSFLHGGRTNWIGSEKKVTDYMLYRASVSQVSEQV